MAGHVPTMMRPERKIARLREHDYRQSGAYSLTICTHERRLVFGKIEEDVVRLHPFGLIAQECWLSIPEHHANVTLDDFVVMPNHIHGILFTENEAPTIIDKEDQTRNFGRPISGSLSAIVGSYKSSVSRKIGEARQCPTRVWQTRFWEHIIRDERDLQNQREYIWRNPANWLNDDLHP